MCFTRSHQFNAPPKSEKATVAGIDDPALSLMTALPTDEFKMAPITFKQRYFHSPGRVIFLTVSSALLVSGGIMGLVSQSKYKDAKTSFDFDEGTTLTKDEYNTLKKINIAGWIMAGVGGLGLQLFFLTPRSSRRIIQDAREESERKRVAQGSTLKLGLYPTGLTLDGTF